MPFAGLIALAFAGCSDAQLRVPLDVGPEEIAIVAVLDGDDVEVRRIRGDASARLDFSPGSTMVVWRFAAGSFVDSAGVPLNAEALGTLQVTTTAAGGCGRCTYDAVASPQRVSPGDVCSIPPFGDVSVYNNDGGLSEVESDAEAIAAEIGARVFLQWPGDCGCEDPPLKTASEIALAQLDDTDGHVALGDVHLFDDGFVLGLSPGHVVAVELSGEVRTRVLDTPLGYVFSSLKIGGELLVAYDSPVPGEASASIVRIARDLSTTEVEGVPPLVEPALVLGPDGALYVGGRVEADGAQRIFRCVPSTGNYTCEAEVHTACDDSAFDFHAGLTTTSSVVVFVGERGQLFVRDGTTDSWACHPGLSAYGFDINGNLYAHDMVEITALTAADQLYMCSTGARSTGVNSRHVTGVVWAIDLSSLSSGIPAQLPIVEVSKEVDALCTSLSVGTNGRVRSLWGFGDLAVDAIDGLVTERHVGVGQPWAGPTPALLGESAGPVLDLVENNGWALAVSAARWLYRRGPGNSTFDSIYVSEGARRGPMTALAATRPQTIVSFGAQIHRYTKGATIERETVAVAGYPAAPDAHSDIALVAPGDPDRALVATHRALLWRCSVLGTVRTPCLPPVSPDEVEVLAIDLAAGEVTARHRPPVANPSPMIDGAALGNDVFVMLDARDRLFAKIGDRFEQLVVEWDDPTTEAVEAAPIASTWEAVDGRDGVAWVVGRGVLGRVSWRPERRLVVEGFWHQRLGAPWTPLDDLETFPRQIDMWCADSGVVMGMATPPASTRPRDVSLWRFGGTTGLGLDRLDASLNAPREFSKPIIWMRPAGAIHLADGTLLYTYDDGTIEPRGGPRHALPFSYVGGHAVSGDFALIGGEGERVVTVEPR